MSLRNAFFMTLGAALVLIGGLLLPAGPGSQAPPDQPSSLRLATVAASGHGGGLTDAEVDFVRWVSQPENARWWVHEVTKDEVQPQSAQAQRFSYSCPRNGWDYGWTLGAFRAEDRATACRVMRCESHVDPNVDPAIIVNRQGSSASGLFQFLDSTWRRARTMVGADQYARAKDAPPQIQVNAAAAWLDATSWTQWECY